MKTSAIARFLVFAIVPLLVSCARTEPARFYLLSPIGKAAQADDAPRAGGTLVVGVGPVQIPSYLDRPQIVTRSGRNSLQFAEFDRWAEPLRESLTRVLAENLSYLLSTEHVFTYPWKESRGIQHQVAIEVVGFETEHEGDAVLAARWTIADARGKELKSAKTMKSSTPSKPGDYGSLVAAQSQILAELSHDIATAVAALATEARSTN